MACSLTVSNPDTGATMEPATFYGSKLGIYSRMASHVEQAARQWGISPGRVQQSSRWTENNTTIRNADPEETF